MGLGVPVINFLAWLCASVVMTGIAEYVAHKYFMHRYFIKNDYFIKIYKEHHVEHHGKHRNDINIDLPFVNHLVFGWPFILTFYILGGIPAAISLCLVFWFHSYTWTKLHRAIHDLEDNWCKKLPFFNFLKEHHENHHYKPNRNYSVVFIFTDYLFGTKI